MRCRFAFCRLVHAFALVAATALLLALDGCTGDTTVAEGGIVGTGVVALGVRGTVSSFGSDSITVNGRKLATAGAVVRVDDAPASVADLRIGMVVDIDGTVTPSGDATATRIVYRADAAGIVDGIDRGAATFTLLGQTVRTDAGTVFDGGTLGTLVSQYAEVSGFRTAPGELLATRVQIRAAVPAGSPVGVTGAVTALDTATRTFRVGALTVDYAAIAPAQVPPQLANGVVVDTRGTQASLGAALSAQSIAIVPATVQAGDGAKVDVEGTITDFASIASFKVNGQAVDAHAATVTGGTAGMLGNGVRVEVEGTLAGGIVSATRVGIESVPSLEVDGLVSAVNTATGTLTVGAQAFAVTAATQFEDRSVAADRDLGLTSLRPGDHVIVTATTLPAPVATRVVRLDLAAPPPSQPDTTYEGAISEFVSVADFKVGGNRVNAASAAFVNGTAGALANGRRVAAVGKLSSGVLLATRVTFEDSTPPSPTALSVEGTITNFASLASFQVAGQAVNASSASVSGGNASSLGNGVRVEVSGTLSNGVLVAQTVEIESTPTTPTAEVEGPITSFTSVSSFVIAGQRIDASSASFSHGAAQDLAVGRVAHAKGPVVNGVLVATTIELQDPEEAEVEGSISQFVSVASFVVAGRTIDASAATFQEGTAAGLTNGVKVGVKGTIVGAVLKASRVEFK